MIKINLLPQDLAQGGARSGGSSSPSGGTFLVVLVLFVLFAANVGLGGYIWVSLSGAEARFNELTEQGKQIEKELKETEVAYNDTTTSLERMQKLIDVANALDPADRLLWSRKLNQLSGGLVPEGIYLTGMTVAQRITERETPESIKARNEWAKAKKGPQPPTVKVPIITQTMAIEGIAHVQDGTATQRLEQIVAFYQNLQKKGIKLPFDGAETKFQDGFGPIIDSAPVSTVKVSGRDVSKFRFNLTTKPLTVQ